MAMRAATAPVDVVVAAPAVATLCIRKHNYTHEAAFEQQKSMYTRLRSLHESTPPSVDPRDDRPRAAHEPGAPRATPAPARLRGHAGDDFARHQGARPGEARR